MGPEFLSAETSFQRSGPDPAQMPLRVGGWASRPHSANVLRHYQLSKVVREGGKPSFPIPVWIACAYICDRKKIAVSDSSRSTQKLPWHAFLFDLTGRILTYVVTSAESIRMPRCMRTGVCTWLPRFKNVVVFFCLRSVGFSAHDHRGCSYSSALHHCYGEHPPPAGAGKVITAIVSSRCCGFSFRVTILDASDIITILIR